MSPAECLRRVVEGRVDQETLNWLIERTRRFVGRGRITDDNLPLGICFGWGTSGTARRYLRNLAIRELAATYEPGDWTRAQAMLRDIRRFKNGAWRRYENAGHVPDGADATAAKLFEIFRANAPIPDCVSTIYKILGGDDGRDCALDGAP